MRNALYSPLLAYANFINSVADWQHDDLAVQANSVCERHCYGGLKGSYMVFPRRSSDSSKSGTVSFFFFFFIPSARNVHLHPFGDLTGVFWFPLTCLMISIPLGVEEVIFSECACLAWTGLIHRFRPLRTHSVIIFFKFYMVNIWKNKKWNSLSFFYLLMWSE